MLWFLCILVLTLSVDSLKLPKYFTQCNLKDPKLNDCALKNVRDNWKTLIEGDDTYHFRNMNPLFVPFVRIKVDDNLYGNITNGYVHRYDTTTFLSIKLDMENKHWEIVYSPDVYNLNGDFEVKGKFLGLPITGFGTGKVTFYGGEYTLKLDYNLIEKNGKQYIEIYKSFIGYDPSNIKGLTFQIEFNGSSLGKIISDALNTSWREISRDIGDSVSSASAGLYSQIINDFFKRVPYDELFSN